MDLKHKIINDTVVKEGGLVNNPFDKGGLTKYGITKPFYAYIKGIKVSQVKDQNIIGLTEAEAKELYGIYYDMIKASYVPEYIRHIYFDMCVNHGEKNAGKILQRTCKDCGFYPGPLDGAIGPNTILALKQSADVGGQRRLLEAVVRRRLAFYKAIVDRDPSQKVFLKGWNKRANWFLTNSLTPDIPLGHTVTTPKPIGFWENLIRKFKGE